MKKTILNLGKSLNKIEQKLVNGGGAVGFCDGQGNCPLGQYCEGIYCYIDDGGSNDPGGNNCTGPWEFCPNGGVSCTGC